MISNYQEINEKNTENQNSKSNPLYLKKLEEIINNSSKFNEKFIIYHSQNLQDVILFNISIFIILKKQQGILPQNEIQNTIDLKVFILMQQ